MNKKEVRQLFMGAIMVAFVQFVLIFLISNFEYTEMTILSANTYLMIIPRFVSAMMMHL